MTANTEIATLKRRITNLEKRRKSNLQEVRERGKELVKVCKVVDCWKDVMQKELYEELSTVVNSFNDRCTM